MQTEKNINYKQVGNIKIILMFLLFAVSLKAQAIIDILGHSGSYFEQKYFLSALGIASTGVNSVLEIGIQGENLKGVVYREEIESEAREGAWRVVLAGWGESQVELTGEWKIPIQKLPSVVMNYGDRFEYVFLSQPILAIVFDEVEEKLKDVKEELLSEYDDMKIEWGRHENSIQISAVYSYAGGVSDGDISDRLEFLFFRSCDLITEIIKEGTDAEEDARDDVENKILTYVTADDFIFITNDNLGALLSQVEGVKEGYWGFNVGGGVYNYEIYNYGDRILFTQWVGIPAELSQESKDEILNKVIQKANDEPAPGSINTEAKWYPGSPDYIYIGAEYKFDGSFSGENLHDYYRNFVYEYGQEMQDEIVELYEEYY